MSSAKLVSLIIPIYNEQKNIPLFYAKLTDCLADISYRTEIIFINDGSTDRSLEELEKIALEDPRIRVIDFSRNFGKEVAVTAGINMCNGDACLMLDGDLQHPIEKIPEFISKWEKGIEVVVGVREKNKGEGMVKKLGSYLFYKIINRIAETKLVPNATDYRLLDRAVINEFNRLNERNRMTRALIDWMGFRREYITFKANARIHGKAGYSILKLTRLAFNSMVSLSLFPLRLAGYLGIFITVISGTLGVFMFITGYILKNTYYTGPAVLAVMILFLIGIVLICLGLIALYIANIHGEVINRPMYIIRRTKQSLPMAQEEVKSYD